APGADTDEVGVADGLESIGVNGSIFGVEENASHPFVALHDGRLSADFGVIFHDGAEFDMVFRRRDDAPTDGEDAASEFECTVNVSAGLLNEAGHDDVADRMSAESSAVTGKTMVKEVSHSFFSIGESNETVAKVAGGKDAEVLDHAPTTATVVGDRND